MLALSIIYQGSVGATVYAILLKHTHVLEIFVPLHLYCVETVTKRPRKFGHIKGVVVLTE